MARALELVPISLKEANQFVENFHRHNRPVTKSGGKFAIGASSCDGLVGVAIVGRPVARLMQDGWTAEVLRTCVLSIAPKGANSFLYAAAWRAWREMGGKKLITYTLATESGASLRGAGWKVVAEVYRSGDWNREKLGRKREWYPIYGQQKFRWEKVDEALPPHAAETAETH